MLRYHLIAFCLLALCLFGTTGQANVQSEDKAKGKQHFENGKTLYAEENYEGAAIEFQASVAAYPTKSGYFNLANCQKALHRYAAALSTIQELRAHFAADLESDPAFQAKVEETARSILERAGKLNVTSKPLEAKIFVDGQPVGTTPLPEPLLLGPGEHIVTAKLPGFVTKEQKVSILSQSESRVAFQLELEQARLIVTVSAANAEVRLDGSLVGRTPLKETLLVEPGQHVVDVTLEGYFPDHREFDLAAGEQVLLDVTLVSEQTLQAPAPAMSAEMLKAFIWGLGGTVVFGSTSGVMFYYRGKAIDEFDRENDSYKTSKNDDDARKYDKARDEAKSRAELFHGFAIATAVAAGVCAVGTLTAVIIAATKGKTKSKGKAEIQAGVFSLGVKF